MKKSLVFLALSSLFLVGCTNSAATELTLDNAPTYINVWGGDATKGNSSSSTNDGKGAYTVVFDLYPTKYAFDTDAKGTCSFTFTPHDGHYVDGVTTKYDPVTVQNAAFAFHAGGKSEDGAQQEDSLQGSFTFTNASLPTLTSSPITSFVFVSISGHILGGK
jgi:hypothetical protein